MWTCSSQQMIVASPQKHRRQPRELMAKPAPTASDWSNDDQNASPEAMHPSRLMFLTSWKTHSVHCARLQRRLKVFPPRSDSVVALKVQGSVRPPDLRTGEDQDRAKNIKKENKRL